MTYDSSSQTALPGSLAQDAANTVVPSAHASLSASRGPVPSHAASLGPQSDGQAPLVNPMSTGNTSPVSTERGVGPGDTGPAPGRGPDDVRQPPRG